MRVIVMMFVLVALVLPAIAQDEEIYEYTPPARGYDPTWPPDGSQWHRIRPADAYCTFAPQTDHDDTDGDGQVDVCENVEIDGVWKHIEWVGPTVSMVSVGGERPVTTLLVEPVENGRQTEYHIIHPPELFCMGLTTNGPLLEPCSYVMVESPPELAGEYHILEVETNIHTTPGINPVDESTWGKIKGFFKEMFR